MDDFDWTASAAFSGRWWNGGRGDLISLRKGTCVAFGRAPVARFGRRAPDAFWFKGLTLRPFPFFTSCVGWSELSVAVFF